GEALADPDLGPKAATGLAALVLAGVAVVPVVLWRRVRWYAGAFAAVLLVVAEQRLDLLFVAAYPTSFYTSPTEFAATAIDHGARLFATNCVSCHGAT